ncbi:MAG: response regulator transcription factor [Elusimicrobia bacterium]|nr:response regulator transcription factor [Elusimicrobiota bacterium]
MPKILITEDDIPLLEMLQQAFEQEGYIIQCASCGRTALQWLKEPVKPDLIILDIGLPDTDGITLCKTIKDDPATRKIPVIILTANMTNEAKIKANTTAHADLFLNKPIELKELTGAAKTLIDEYLKQKTFLSDISLKRRFLSDNR